ncbi:MAG: SDR family oxidoreductase [Actinobacteria bacterium]|nr:MAG: SDR family oxidoreductase [Actinomycetota bacterium]
MRSGRLSVTSVTWGRGLSIRTNGTRSPYAATVTFDLTGRVALVTGAGQGVGAGVAHALAAQGATVVVNDLSAERAGVVVDELVEAGASATAAVADVTDLTAVSAMVGQIERTVGPVDVLVNNAGLPAEGIRLRQFRDTTLEDWEPLLRLNLYAVLHCCHAVVAGMCDRGWGRLVTISSEAGRMGSGIGLSLYGAGKAAAVGFSRNLAREVAGSGVTVNCLSLGTIWREGVDEERLARPYPIGRLGRAADVAAAVVFLASEEAAWVTGQTIPVNGGIHTS